MLSSRMRSKGSLDRTQRFTLIQGLVGHGQAHDKEVLGGLDRIVRQMVRMSATHGTSNCSYAIAVSQLSH